MSVATRTRGASAMPTAPAAATAARSSPAAIRGHAATRAASEARAVATTAASRNHALTALKKTTFPVSRRPSRKSSRRRKGSTAKPTYAALPERMLGALRASANHVSHRKTVRRYAATWFPTSADIRMPDARYALPPRRSPSTPVAASM